MADWFRQTRWSDAIEAEFFRRLARARPRSRRQYLLIQLQTLLDTDARRYASDVLRLIERWPTDAESGVTGPVYYDDDRVGHLVVRAQARRWAGDLGGSIADYRELIAYQRSVERLGTWLEDLHFADLVIEHDVLDCYAEAYELLCTPPAVAPMFPKRRFERALACARLAHRLGRATDAARHANDAIAETKVTRTSLQKHPHLLLVQSPDPAVLAELTWLADPGSRH